MPRPTPWPRSHAWLAAWLATSALIGAAWGQTAPGPLPVTAANLPRLAPAQLDTLFRAAGPGLLPRGRVRGIPLVAPGTSYGPRASRAARLVWQGKVFRDDGATAINRFFGVRLIEGNLSTQPSWLDGQPALILDYATTSRIYARYRDEIREVAPGLYLGVMWARTDTGPKFHRYFAFSTQP